VAVQPKINTLLHPITSVEDAGSSWFAQMLPAIAKKHGFTIVAAHWTVPPGIKPTWSGYGQSRIISSPWTGLFSREKETLARKLSS